MAVGVIVRGKCIKGSCGGLAHIPGLESSCTGCEKKTHQHNEKGTMP
ncbi:MAG: (Na+)-NQR maturation NqrM [Gammaproteobacteria bacterium]|nr:(Na+)-NQR maturation NqrM [Gammaproteobacteria bacterium]MDH5650505.1 (Na+)-NQR maturation NqrM [Gammaproteobacteria bacterium]